MEKTNCQDCGRPIKIKPDFWKPISQQTLVWICPNCADLREKAEKHRIAELYRKKKERKVRIKCSSCNGNGRIKGYKCMACNGSGKIESTEGGPSFEELYPFGFRTPGIGKPI